MKTAEAQMSLSTLERLKTWLRSTSFENRLNGLAMLIREVNVDVENDIMGFANSGARNFYLRLR